MGHEWGGASVALMRLDVGGVAVAGEGGNKGEV